MELRSISNLDPTSEPGTNVIGVGFEAMVAFQNVLFSQGYLCQASYVHELRSRQPVEQGIRCDFVMPTLDSAQRLAATCLQCIAENDSNRMTVVLEATEGELPWIGWGGAATGFGRRQPSHSTASVRAWKVEEAHCLDFGHTVRRQENHPQY